MKTTIHAYQFDVGDPEQRAAYDAMVEKIRATPGRGHWMNCLAEPAGKRYPLAAGESAEITLETGCLFENQWNEADRADRKGWRVFDWYEGIYPNRAIRSGHYLDITEEMREIRRNTVKCRYCGKEEPAAKGYVFCPHCLDSEYLKEEDLKLTRMLAIDADHFPGDAYRFKRDNLPELTKAEAEHLAPLYIKAQTEGAAVRGKARLRKERADLKSDCRAKIANARIHRDGMLWLLGHGMQTGNVIYYDHTKTFCFGWRTPVGEKLKSQILDIISEFPYPYQIKTKGGDP